MKVQRMAGEVGLDKQRTIKKQIRAEISIHHLKEYFSDDKNC